MSLWNVKVQRKDDPTDEWTAIVLAATEIGAKRVATLSIGNEYHSVGAHQINPFNAGTILTVQYGAGVQYERKEANTYGQR